MALQARCCFKEATVNFLHNANLHNTRKLFSTLSYNVLPAKFLNTTNFIKPQSLTRVQNYIGTNFNYKHVYESSPHSFNQTLQLHSKNINFPQLLFPCYNSFIFCGLRNICQLTMASDTNSNVREFKIEVPYGQIAGKVWNEGGTTAVLCIHGWQDNAGTFDRLAPLLPKHLCLVAMDLPGHGFSSHKPLGMSSDFMNYVVAVDRVVKHYGWKQVVILAHSMGAACGMLYAGARPSLVHSLIMLDMVKPIHIAHEAIPENVAESLDAIFKTEHIILHKQKPSYDFEELLQRAMKSHAGSIGECGVRTLLQRGARQLPSGKYVFTYDLQVRTRTMLPMTLEQQMAFADSLRCRLLILKAEDSPYYQGTDYLDTLLDKYKTAASEFSLITVPGGHHTHLETPETVAGHICHFFSEEKLKGAVNNRTDDGDSVSWTEGDPSTSHLHYGSLIQSQPLHILLRALLPGLQVPQ